MSDSAVSAGAPTSAGGGWDQLQTSVSRDPAPPSHRCLCHESVIITEFLCRPPTGVFIFTQKNAGKLTSSLPSRVKLRESYQWQSHTANKNVTPAVIFSASKQVDDECVTIDNPSLFIPSDAWLFLGFVTESWQLSEDISHCHRMSLAWK